MQHTQSKRRFLKSAAYSTLAAIGVPLAPAWAKVYLSAEQAKQILFPDTELEPVAISLTKEQSKAIKKASKVRVRQADLQVWRTPDNHWFILDQVIGKHENIDMAFALSSEGKVLGMEILTYRESYGHEIRWPKWRAQFHGRDKSEHLKLEKQIKNISGATLSCRHVTDGVNRWVHTWDLVLKSHQV